MRTVLGCEGIWLVITHKTIGNQCSVVTTIDLTKFFWISGSFRWPWETSNTSKKVIENMIAVIAKFIAHESTEPLLQIAFEGSVQNIEKHGGNVWTVVISAVTGGSNSKQQLKAVIKFKWLCSFLVCFHCGAAVPLSCPYTGSECSDGVVGWLLSHQTECGDRETKACVFSPSLMAENKGLVILNHLIFTAGMFDWLDWLRLRHPPSKRLWETPSRDGDVVCFLKRPQSVRNRTC